MTEEELSKMEKETNGQDDFVFIREEIKARPINRKKLARTTFVSAVSAVVFGLVACVTFALLAPFILEKLSDKQEEPERVDSPVVISFPEETAEEEMTPDEMLITPIEPEIDYSQIAIMEEEDIKALISSMKFSVNDYQDLYKSLSEIANNAMKSVVRVTPVAKSMDWFSNIYETESELSGLIVGDNGSELFIATKLSEVKGFESILVTFCNGVQAKAEIADYDSSIDLCVLSVLYEDINEATKESISVATLGVSSYYSVVGSPIIAIGSPLGVYKSVNYGIVTSNTGKLTVTDNSFKQLITNIYGSSHASGVLINLKGEVIGIIDTKFSSQDARNLVCAIGISELKKPLERMMNRIDTMYLGITGSDVPPQDVANGAPDGVFVLSVEIDSPAMRAGIQSGDIIDEIGLTKIAKFSDFLIVLRSEELDTTETFTVYRNSQGVYKRIDLEVYFDTVKK